MTIVLVAEIVQVAILNIHLKTINKMKRFLLLVAVAVFCVNVVEAQSVAELPKELHTSGWKAGHVQGIAVDSQRKYVYLSFTTMLVKMDMQGNIVGTVTGLLGHLGCLEFNEEDGRVYGSLEYKDDSIGRGIMRHAGVSKQLETGFYVAIFDVDKITRKGMSAEKDGVMTTVLLKSVVKDYQAKVKDASGKVLEHRHGCSGFDGISFGDAFDGSGKRLLTIAYGIYSDKSRSDNDYQVLLQYDTRKWAKYESPLSQDNMHHRGPAKPEGKYFVYTGNTNWGVQNLEYDKDSKRWFLACYRGKKPTYSNFSLYVVDGAKKAEYKPLKGVSYVKRGAVLSLAEGGKVDTYDSTIRGWHNKYGAYGVCALGDGYFYLVSGGKVNRLRTATLHLAKFKGAEDCAFELIK